MNAFFKTLKASDDSRVEDKDFKTNIRKLVFYGVKAVNSKEKSDMVTEDEATYNFQLAEVIKAFMGSLTPGEFISIFPIDKNYDGAKYGIKDYFTTME